MTDRRTEILDGALHVLAEHGGRGLTHRAVDTATGIPAGSTSYYFRTRSALVSGCVTRLLELDLALDAPAVQVADVDALTEALTGTLVRMATTQRYRTLARYELSLAATRDPALRAVLLTVGDTIRGLLAGTLAAFGVTEPDIAAEEVAAALDGLVFTALVRGPDDPAALATWLHPALRRILTAQPGMAPRAAT